MRVLLITIMVLVSSAAYARPVSYPGGWTFMQTNDTDSHNLHVHYSPTAKYSIGYRAEYHKSSDWQFHGLQLNYLVKRWNKPQSQANFYIKTAVGGAYTDYQSFDGKSEAAGSIGIATDWEDRRFFTSYENKLTYAGDIEKAFQQKARVGVAPYIGDYGDVHTWLMLEVDHNPKREHELVVTPLVRVFKGVYLFEAGVTSDNDFLLNSVIRF